MLACPGTVKLEYKCTFTGRRIGMQADRQCMQAKRHDRLTSRQGRHTDRQAGRQIDTQANRQTDRQTGR
jgi:hypothetical protein